MYRLLDEHSEFIVIDKSPRVHFHSQTGEAGVVAQVEADRQEKLYPVHRLDTPTSGLLLLARSSQGAAALSQLFADHKIEKRYLALSDQKPKRKQGSIKGGMSKARRGAWKLTRERDNYACTEFVSIHLRVGLRAYLLRPLSGRTHQIRVAMKSLGAPILGDDLYGGTLSDRTYLHAIGLKFSLNGQEFHYWSVPEVGEQYQSEELREQLVLWHNSDIAWPSLKR